MSNTDPAQEGTVSPGPEHGIAPIVRDDEYTTEHRIEFHNRYVYPEHEPDYQNHFGYHPDGDGYDWRAPTRLELFQKYGHYLPASSSEPHPFNIGPLPYEQRVRHGQFPTLNSPLFKRDNTQPLDMREESVKLQPPLRPLRKLNRPRPLLDPIVVQPRDIGPSGVMRPNQRIFHSPDGTGLKLVELNELELPSYSPPDSSWAYVAHARKNDWAAEQWWPDKTSLLDGLVQIPPLTIVRGIRTIQPYHKRPFYLSRSQSSDDLHNQFFYIENGFLPPEVWMGIMLRHGHAPPPDVNIDSWRNVYPIFSKDLEYRHHAQVYPIEDNIDIEVVERIPVETRKQWFLAGWYAGLCKWNHVHPINGIYARIGSEQVFLDPGSWVVRTYNALGKEELVVLSNDEFRRNFSVEDRKEPS